jgi:hypothetical protein
MAQRAIYKDITKLEWTVNLQRRIGDVTRDVNKYRKPWYGDRKIRSLNAQWGPLMVAQWLRYCATNRKVAGSITDGVIGIFH